MSSDVAQGLILFAKHLFDQKKIRKSFNNDNKYKVPQKHSSHPITLISIKTGLVKRKYGVVRTVFMATPLMRVLVLVV